MKMHRCKVKFHKDKIVCASEVLCSDCPERKSCEDIDLYIDGKYEGTKDCMSHDSHRREKGKVRQKKWRKD